MKKLILAAFLFATPAMAQETILLRVNNAELGVIGKALGTLPYNEVSALLNKLQEQIIAQQKPEANAPTPEKK